MASLVNVRAADAASAPSSEISVVDLFCGAGGLSLGLKSAGLNVVAGVDIDDECEHAYRTNIGAPFIKKDIREVHAADLEQYWTEGSTRMLAGCAPCQPFSPYRRGVDTSEEEQWPLLREFSRLVSEVRPSLVTMENVPRIGQAEVFRDFIDSLETMGYFVDWRSCYGPKYGLPQNRRRLVLLASLFGSVSVPEGNLSEDEFRTVRDAIGDLTPIASGETDPTDPLHRARRLSELNLKRLAASKPGGTWEDWPDNLLAPCHARKSGSTFKNVYARMAWDEPSPTITTLAHNFGAGRFGHPDQQRAISLREAALLQGFPASYSFIPQGEVLKAGVLGRLIGNAVPPPIAEAVGRAAIDHIQTCEVVAP